MATVFGKEERGFYEAFFIPDTAKRREKLDEWIKTTTPAIQAAVSEELKSFVDWVTSNRWDEKGWRAGEEKLRRIQNEYHLVMDINLRKVGSRERVEIKGILLDQWTKREFCIPYSMVGGTGLEPVTSCV